MRKTIRQYREERGWTQLELANKLEVTPATVYTWERGRNEPRVAQLRKMAELFGVLMDDFELPEVERPVKILAAA